MIVTLHFPSETTAQGVKKTKLAQTLLNGSNIALVSLYLVIILGNGSKDRQQLIPGSNGPEDS